MNLIVYQVSAPGPPISCWLDDFDAYDRESRSAHAFNASTTYQNYWSLHALCGDTTTLSGDGVAFNDLTQPARYASGRRPGCVTIIGGGATTDHYNERRQGAAGPLHLANGTLRRCTRPSGLFHARPAPPIARRGASRSLVLPLGLSHRLLTSAPVTTSLVDAATLGQEGAAGVSSATSRYASACEHATSRSLRYGRWHCDGGRQRLSSVSGPG